MNFKHCTPTKIHKLLTHQAVADYGCSQAIASTLIKQALQQPSVQAAILEYVGDALADAASATVADTQSPDHGDTFGGRLGGVATLHFE